jgi:hypothetical protein
MINKTKSFQIRDIVIFKGHRYRIISRFQDNMRGGDILYMIESIEDTWRNTILVNINDIF